MLHRRLKVVVQLEPVLQRADSPIFGQRALRRAVAGYAARAVAATMNEPRKCTGSESVAYWGDCFSEKSYQMHLEHDT